MQGEASGLEVCGSCGAYLVEAEQWARLAADYWWFRLVCPECGWLEELIAERKPTTPDRGVDDRRTLHPPSTRSPAPTSTRTPSRDRTPTLSFCRRKAPRARRHDQPT